MPETKQRVPHAKRIALSLSFVSVLAIATAVMTGTPYAVCIAAVLLVLLAAAILILRRRAVCRVLVPILLLSVIALLRFGLAYQCTARHAVSVLETYAGTKCACEGYAESDAAPNDTLYVELFMIDGKSLAHPVKAYARNNTGDILQEGDALSFRAEIRLPKNGKNSTFDFVKYLSSRGVFVQLGTLSETSINEVRSARFRPFAVLRRFVTRRLENALSTLPSGAAYTRTLGMTKALLFGDKSAVPDDDLEAMRRCGVTHLLCVSGMHFAVVFGLLSLLLSRLTGSRTVRRVVLWIISLIYLALCGFALSAVRAALMAAASGFRGKRGGKQSGGSDSGYRLLMAATLILLIFPYAALDVGFHLSFLATLGIQCAASLSDRASEKTSGAASGILNVVKTFLLVPLGAFVFTAPYSIAAFGGVSAVALPVSCLTVYPAEALLIAAWLCVVLCPPLRPVAFVFASVMETLANCVCGISGFFASWRFAYLPFTASDHSLFVWLIMALLAAFLNIFRRRRPAALLTLTALVPLGIAFAALSGAS